MISLSLSLSFPAFALRSVISPGGLPAKFELFLGGDPLALGASLLTLGSPSASTSTVAASLAGEV